MENLEEQRLTTLNEKLNEKRTKDDKEYEEFEEEFENDDEYEDTEITPEDFKEIKVQKPEIPDFPGLVFSVALAKDFFDVISVVLGIITGGIALGVLIWIVWFVTAIAGIIIWIWMFNKSTFIRKYLIKKYLVKWVLFLIAKLIPGLNAVPTISVTVYLVYKSEYGLVKKIVDAVEKIERIERKIA